MILYFVLNDTSLAGYCTFYWGPKPKIYQLLTNTIMQGQTLILQHLFMMLFAMRILSHIFESIHSKNIIIILMTTVIYCHRGRQKLSGDPRMHQNLQCPHAHASLQQADSFGSVILSLGISILWHRRSKISLLGVIIPSELPPNITLHWNDYL